MVVRLILLFYLVQSSYSAVHELNEIGYRTFPALFGLEEYQPCLQDGGLYCLAQFNLYADPPNELMHSIKVHSSHDKKRYKHEDIERGMCVTKTCRKFLKHRNINETADLADVIEECQNETIWRDYNIKVKLLQIYYCEKQGDQSAIDISDIIVLALLSLILIINILGSCYDILSTRWYNTKNGVKTNHMLLSFSIFQNVQTLSTQTNEDDRIVRLKGIHGLRSLTQMGVVLAHTTMLIATGFTENPQDFEKYYDLTLPYIVLNGPMGVQVFFVISGYLLVYILEIKLEKDPKRPINLLSLMFYRWLRLTSVCALVISVSATWLRHAGSGPLWQLYVTQGTSADCRAYWWLHLLYANNFVPDDNLCVLQSWYTAAETQLFILGLIVYKLTRARGRNVTLLLLVVIGITATAIHQWIHDLDSTVMFTPEFYRRVTNKTFDTMHVLPHVNLPSFAIGMGAGHLVYSCERKGIDLAQSKILKILTWFILPAALFLFLYGSVFYSEPVPTSWPLALIYGSLHRPALGCVIALQILCLAFRINDLYCRFLEWRGWVLFSKLSYGVFMVHLVFIHSLLGARTQLLRVSTFYWISIFFGLLVASIIVAFLLYILVEAPMYRILKLFTENKVIHKTSKQL